MADTVHKRDSLSPMWVFLIAFSIGFIWLLGAWPGFLHFDSYQYLSLARISILQTWLSITLSYLIMLADLTPNVFGTISLFHIFIFSVLMAFHWNVLKKMGASRTYFIFTLIVVLNPLVLGMNIFFNREVLLGLLVGFLIIYPYKWKYVDEGRISFASLTCWAIILGVVSELRQDSRVYLVLLPVLVGVIKVFDWKKTFLSGLIGISTNALILSPFIFNFHWGTPFQDAYMLTGSFTTVYAQDSFEEKDLEVLGQVFVGFDPVGLKETDDPYSYLLSRMNKQPSMEVKEAYYSLIRKLLIRNPWKFLKDRIKRFPGILGSSDQYTIWYLDDLSGANEFLDQMRDKLGLKKDSKIPQLMSIQTEIMRATSDRFYKIIFFNNLPGLVLSIIGLLFLKVLPVSGVAAVVFLVKYLIVFLIAPIPNPNYMYMCYLGSLLLVPLMVQEWKIRTRNNLSDPASHLKLKSV